MWIASPEAWNLFFRIGFLVFVVLCTAAGLCLFAGVILHCAERVLLRFYCVAAIVEVGRELRQQGKAPAFERLSRYIRKLDGR